MNHTTLTSFRRRPHPFLLYTLSFPLMILMVYAVFFLQGRGFIWQSDGLAQHFPAFAAYGRWLREIFRNFFIEHTFSIPVWNFSIGLGADMITTLHYYCLGDPLGLLAGLFPYAWAEVGYLLVILLRLYLIGLAFMLMCRQFGKADGFAVIGAYLYLFCSYSLFAAVRHPYFVTPMLYMPLIVVGIERIFAKKSPVMFILSVCGITISNFYFAYMVLLLAVVYAIVRFCAVHHDHFFRDMGQALLRFIPCGLLGLGLAAVIFLPVVLTFLSADRAQVSHHIGLLYSGQYYDKFISGFMGHNGLSWWGFTGYSPLCVLCLIFAFSRRERYHNLKPLLLIGLIVQMFPVFGHILNGFSYVTNRYVWVYALLLAFLCVYVIEDLLRATRREKRNLLIGCAVYFGISLMLKGIREFSSFTQFGVLALMLLAVLFADKIRPVPARRLLGGLCILAIFINSLACFAPPFKNYAAQFPHLGNVSRQLSSSVSSAFRVLRDPAAFSRYEKSSKRLPNQSLLNGSHGVSFYWSLAGDHMAEFIREMELTVETPYYYHDLDHRYILDTLASVRYFTVDNDTDIPWNFSLSDEHRGIQLYEHGSPLPLGYTYEASLSREDYLAMTPLQRQEAMLQAVVLEQPVPGTQADSLDLTSADIPCTVTLSDQVEPVENGILVKADNAIITLDFEGLPGSETYLSFSGLEAEALTPWQLEALSDPDPSLKDRLSRAYRSFYYHRRSTFPITILGAPRYGTFKLATDRYQFYNDTHDFTQNLGYSEEALTQVKIRFPCPGIYTWEDLQIHCQPMQPTQAHVDALAEDTLQAVVFSSNQVSGSIDLEQAKILCLSIPHSAGWSAEVDGQKAELLRANTWAMALALEPGHHEIVLRYHTPGLDAGAVLSGLSLLALGGVWLWYHRKKKI